MREVAATPAAAADAAGRSIRERICAVHNIEVYILYECVYEICISAQLHAHTPYTQ